MTRHVSERFWKHVEPEPNSGCWIWIGSRLFRGYGHITVKREGKWTYPLAHRLSYELFVGPIPSGLTIDHKCKMVWCVNPSHLEPVTLEENVRRGNPNTKKTLCNRGHPYDVIYNGHRHCRQCDAIRDRQRNRKGKKLRIPKSLHTPL